ncbi:MAG: hypothetical protein IT306_27200 [Chloroflexi bacterium]|nr:hypothetical protein [Chloroflexota bacterium]
MGSIVVSTGSLPLTATAVRNARLRAAGIALIPALLFLFAAAPRLLQPDLVPFGSTQARYVTAAENAGVVSGWQLVGDPSHSALAWTYALLAVQSSPVIGWVIVRGLLDALGVAFLYLSARPILGVRGAVALGLLSSVSPILWSASRDPAGSLSALLTALALWAGVALARRPTLVRGGLFGLALGLLMRADPFPWLPVAIGAVALGVGRASWRVGSLTALCMLLLAWPVVPAMRDATSLGSVVSGLLSPSRGLLTSLWPLLCLAIASPLLVRRRAVRWLTWTVLGGLCALSVAITVLDMQADASAEWQRSIFDSRAGNPYTDASMLAVTGTLGSRPSLREVDALTRGLREAAGRSDAHEVTVVDSQTLRMTDVITYAVRRAGLHERGLQFAIGTLPLEREALYLVAEHARAEATRPWPAEFLRPSSSVQQFTPEGVPLGLSVLSLRPRDADHWLMKTVPVANGEFADGTVLRGVALHTVGSLLSVTTYWQLPTRSQTASLGERVRVSLSSTGQAPTNTGLPSLASRHADELTVLTVLAPLERGGPTSATLDLQLFDSAGSAVARTDGAPSLSVPIGLPHR